MEPITRNIRDIAPSDRQALEHLLGTPLHDNQQVIVTIVESAMANRPPANNPTMPPRLPDWCDVYAGLSDEAIDRLDGATKQRLDLTRPTST
jgi:hypothetical protein